MRKKANGKKAAAIIAAVILAISMAACAASSDSGKKAITSSGGASSDAGTASADASAATESGSSQSGSSGTTIDEQVLMDAEGVKVTALKYTEDELYGDGIKILIENNSDKNVGITSDATIVNDYMLTDLFSSEVAAGKKSNETIYLMSSELKAAGIENVGQIEIYLHLYDPDTYETTYTADPVTIKTNKYDEMDTEPNDDGQELYNDNGFRIVGKYVDEDTIWGNGIVLYLENNTDQNVTFQCDDMSVNGYMMTPYFSSTVYAGKKAISEITLMQSELDDNGIDSVDNVELTFHIFNNDTYETIVDTDPIQFSTQQ